MYEYDIIFETDSRQITLNKQAACNIHDLIKKIRDNYPNAHTFRVVNKVRI